MMDYEMAMKRNLDLMSTAKAAYLTTIDANEYPETRAMLNLRNGDKYPGLVSFFSRHNTDLTTYFTTNTSSPKVQRIREKPKACVYYSKPDEWRGLMVAGKLEIVEDEEIKKALWQSTWTMYYPGGVEDEDYAVLRLRPAFVQGYHQFQHSHIDLDESK
jgi:general stress protein 26